LLEKAKTLEMLASRSDGEQNKQLRKEAQEYMKLAKQYAPANGPPAEKA